MSLLTAFDELTVNDHCEQPSEPGEHVESSTSDSPVLNSGVDTHIPFSLSHETKEDHFQGMYHERARRRHRREEDENIDMRISPVTSEVEEVTRWSLCPLSLAKHTVSLAPGTLSNHKSACRGEPRFCLGMEKRRQKRMVRDHNSMTGMGDAPEEEKEQVDGWSINATVPDSFGGKASSETVEAKGDAKKVSG